MLNHKDVYIKSLEEGMKGSAYSTLPPTTTSSSPYFVDLNNAYNIGQFAYDIGKSISANCGGTGSGGSGGGSTTVPPHDHDTLYAPKIHNHNDLYYTKAEEDFWRDRLINGNLLFNKINANHIQAGSITAGSGIIANGAIGSAHISSLSVDKLEGGILDTAKFTVQGTNGHLKIVNNKLQINERTGNTLFERVALGDIKGDGSIYGLVVRGKDGQTVLYDENGVYNAGITNGAITDEKVDDNANISGTKLNIQSVIEGINGDNTTTIKGLKVDIDGESINTVINQINIKQEEHSESITRHESEIEQTKDEIALKVSSQQYEEDMLDMTSKLSVAESEIKILQDGMKLTATKTEVQNQITGVRDFVSEEIDGIAIGGANYINNSAPRKAVADTTINWDKTLNGTHQLVYWQDYNPNVQNPQMGYHPHIDLDTFHFPCIALINRNGTYLMANRELSLKQEIHDAINFIVPDEEYTISFDGYSDASTFSFTGGLYHKVSESGDYDYHSTRMDAVVRPLDVNKWKRYSYTFRTHKGIITNQPVYFIINGHNNPESSAYIKNIKLERSNIASHWTPSEFDLEDMANDVVDDVVDYVNEEIKTLESSIDVKVDSITQRVTQTENGIDGLNVKYTEIKQTVDSIDMTGVVRFNDLSGSGQTIINGDNITTGSISGDRIKGGTISATDEINFVGGARIFGNAGAYGAGLLISAQEFSFKSGASFFENDATFRKNIICDGNVKGSSLTGGQLTVTGDASIASIITNKLEVYGATRCNGTFYASGEGTFASNLNVKNAPIYGMNYLALARGVIYVPQDSLGSITADYIRFGDAVMLENSNHIYFVPRTGSTYPAVHFANRIVLARGSVYLPATNSPHVTDYLRIGGGFMCGVDSGNFHFITNGGARSAIYCGTVSSTYSLDQATIVDDVSVFDEINSINVINTDEGYKAIDVSRDTSKSKVITISYNDKTEENEVSMDVTSSISMLIKAVQELKEENNYLKQIIEGR